MQQSALKHVVTVDTSQPIWERFFMVSPLVLVGTREDDGGYDFAPKHMVIPLSWENYVGFVCIPRHGTYRNSKRTAAFTISYLRPSQVLEANLAAAPRCEDDRKTSLEAVKKFPATKIDGMFVEDGYLYLECEVDRIIDGFGENSLIVGHIIAAHVHEDCLRDEEQDDQDLIHASPLLAYLHPGRFASIDTSRSFPFPEGMKK
ncbi:MAG: flavin reductase [Gammaproteobacteria bacterium]|nr:flavin reductase [Gammaproteobacteria bacterium]